MDATVCLFFLFILGLIQIVSRLILDSLYSKKLHEMWCLHMEFKPHFEVVWKVIPIRFIQSYLGPDTGYSNQISKCLLCYLQCNTHPQGNIQSYSIRVAELGPRCVFWCKWWKSSASRLDSSIVRRARRWISNYLAFVLETVTSAHSYWCLCHYQSNLKDVWTNKSHLIWQITMCTVCFKVLIWETNLIYQRSEQSHKYDATAASSFRLAISSLCAKLT